MAGEEIDQQSDEQADVRARYDAWVSENPEVQRRIAKAKAANGKPREPITADQLKEWLDAARAGRPVRPRRRH